MRIIVQSFAQVLDSQNLRLVLSFEQAIFILAPTKRLLLINSNRGVLGSFLVAESFHLYLISKFSPFVFSGEKLGRKFRNLFLARALC